jgi:hypothetical protein
MRETRMLRAVFLAGAVTDAVTLLPMLLPSFATLLWGLHDVATLTFLVIGGIVVSEIAGSVAGVVDARRVVPAWCLQAILLVLLGWASYTGRQASRAPQVLS